MRTHAFVAALAVVMGVTGSAFAAPSIFIVSESRHVIREDGFPQFANLTHFGDVQTNGGIHENAYIIHNRGDQVLNLGLLFVSWIGPSGWGFGQIPVFTLAPDESTTFSLKFLPTVASAHFARLTISSDDPMNPSVDFFLAGNGVPFDAAKPDLGLGVISAGKTKVGTKNNFNFLSGSFVVPIQNVGPGRSDKLVPAIRVFSSSDGYIDEFDTQSLKLYPVKKELEPGGSYLMKVKVSVPILPGADHVIFRLETPDNYEEDYKNNVMAVPFP